MDEDSGWVKLEDGLPNIEGTLLTLIENTLFAGECFFIGSKGFYSKASGPMVIDFEMNKTVFEMNKIVPGITMAGAGWLKPIYYKTPSHWRVIQLPENKNG